MHPTKGRPVTITVDPDKITAALADSPRFTNPEEVALLTPHVLRLPEIVGQERLAQPVTLTELMAMTTEFIRKSLAGDRQLPEAAKEALGSLAALLDELDVMATLEANGLSEADAMLSDDIGLSPAARELYRAGELTFAKLIETSPAVFVPEST
jgi:hypothetical protein